MEIFKAMSGRLKIGDTVSKGHKSFPEGETFYKVTKIIRTYHQDVSQDECIYHGDDLFCDVEAEKVTI